MTRIFLIGMPGSGKSTMGRRLAEKIEFPFIDLDNAIEEQERTTITEIFKQKGEKYFREVEARIMKELVLEHHDLIMATGGGTPCFFDNLDYMKKQGTVIFLKASIDTLLNRVRREEHRPLLKGNQDMESGLSSLLNDRIQYYQQADHTIQQYYELEQKVLKLLSGSE